MSGDILHHIQTLQFHDKDKAESLLLSFLRDIYSPHVSEVQLRPLVVSLNSFNGYVTLLDGRRLFFKSHTESDTIIDEYYNAKHLADLGYPIISPVFSSTEVGKQLLIYDIINSPSVFDVAWDIENGQNDLMMPLQSAQEKADTELLSFYFNSLTHQSADHAAKSPIHQLFYHRLTGGRLGRFYGHPGERTKKQIQLPGGIYSVQKLWEAQWEINGQRYTETLEMIIRRAITVLYPAQSSVSIIGHGDAHNGNVFFQEHGKDFSLLYFDPAFAGQHSPLLDLAKPLFHNVFAMWMYFPNIMQKKTQIKFDIRDRLWVVNHDYILHPIREMFLRSKIDNVLIPLLYRLKMQNRLRRDWREYLKLALFCCPLLTMNLADSEKFPPEITLLGLTMAIEMGADSEGRRSFIDRVLDEVEGRIGR